MSKRNPLLDVLFLQQLYSDRHKEIFAKIIALDKNENPVEEIEGHVTGGSVSLDGTSNVRRSCNLTMVAENVDINAYYWGFKNKFKLSIGLSNHVNSDYDDIIWFPMGVFVITSFNTALSTGSYTINISGKDKMCLLNGELSGSLFAAHDFGKEEVYNKKTTITTINDIPIKTIIREAVHEYASELWENIIINDLDDIGLELLDYQGSTPLYLFISEQSGSNEDLGNVFQIDLNGNREIKLYNSNTIVQLKDIQRYNPRVALNFEDAPVADYDLFEFISDPNDTTSASSPIFSVAKVEYGQTCGYRYTDITYAGDLILNVGEPITAMLDKLVAMLGNWEYFYDVDGRFIFQRRNTYLDKTWNTIITNNDDSYVPTMGETYVENAAWSSAVSWNFTDGFFITAFNNNPALNNVHNDYSIWGTRTSISGAELPVHLRYAIDTKPTYYKTIPYTEKKTHTDGTIEEIFHDSVEWNTDVGEWWVQDGVGVIHTTFETLREMVKEEAKEKIRQDIYTDLDDFELIYPAINGLQRPQKQADGSWSAGWWDVRDWHLYHKMLTGEDPTYHMRMYATNITNDPALPRGYVENFNFGSVFPGVSLTRTVWLFNGYKYEDGTYYIDIQHNNRGTELSTYLDDDGVTRQYAAPFSGCSSHTYTFFENWCSIMDKPVEERKHMGKQVVDAFGYFYVPNFPDKSDDIDWESYVESKVEEQFANPDTVIEFLDEKGYHLIQHKAENLCDWREIIFQMAKDYRRHMHEDDFLLKVRETNGRNRHGEWYYPSGKTGYEQYYTDLEGFWRQLYCPPQLLDQWRETGVWTDRAMNIASATYSDDDNTVSVIVDNAAKTNILYFLSTNWVEEGHATLSGWNKQVIDEPANINFWFDFLNPDEDADFSRYSVPAIGDRAKSVNDSNVKAIYFREIPNTIFTDDITTVDRKSGYTYMQYQETMNRLFKVSTQGKCAIDVMEEWINNYVYAVESVNMTAIPIYHLQPNTLISVMSQANNINGNYVVSRISIPLVYNGTMSITATKVADRIY